MRIIKRTVNGVPKPEITVRKSVQFSHNPFQQKFRTA